MENVILLEIEVVYQDVSLDYANIDNFRAPVIDERNQTQNWTTE